MTSGQTDQHNDPDNTGPSEGGASQDQEGNGSQSSPAPQKSAAQQEKEDLANLGKLMLDIADIIDDQETAGASAATEIPTGTPTPPPTPEVKPASPATQELLDTPEAAEPPKPTSSQTKLNPFFALSEAAAKRTQEQALLKLQEEAEQTSTPQATPEAQPAATQPEIAPPVESSPAPQPTPQAAEPAVQTAEQAPQDTPLNQAVEATEAISEWAAPAPTAPTSQSPAKAPIVVPTPVISPPPQWALDAAAAAPPIPEPEPAPAAPPPGATSPPILHAVVSKREIGQSAQPQAPESQAPPDATEWTPTVETASSEVEPQLQGMPVDDTQPNAQTTSAEPLYDPYKPYQPEAYEPQSAYDPLQQGYDHLQQQPPPDAPQQSQTPLEQACNPLQQAYDSQPGFPPQQEIYEQQQANEFQDETYDTQPHYEPQTDPGSAQSQQEQPAEPEKEEAVDLRTLFSDDASPVTGSLPKTRDLSHQSTSRSLIRRRTNEAQAPRQPSKPTPTEGRSDSSTEAIDLRNLFSDDAAQSSPSPPAPPTSYNQPASPPQSAQITPETQAQEQRLSAEQAAIRKTLETSAEFGALADDEFKVTHTPEQLQSIAQETKKPKPRKTFLGLPSWGANNSLTAGDPGAQNQQPPPQKGRKTFFGLPTFGSSESVSQQPEEAANATVNATANANANAKPRKTFFGLPAFGSNEAVNEQPPSEPGAKPRKTFLGIPAIPLVENLFNRDAPPAEPLPEQQTFEPEFIDTPSDPNRQTVFDRAAQTAAEYEQEPGADDLSEWIKSAHYAFERGQFEVAERYYLRVLGLMELRQDLEESLVITCMKNLGDVYFFLGKTEDAVDVFEQLASNLEKTPDETYLNIIVDLARAYGTIGKLSQGSELCMRAMQLAGDILPPGHELHGRLNNAYVGIIRRKSGDSRSVDLTGAPNKHQTQERPGIGLRGKVAVRLEPIEDETRVRSNELMKSKDFLAALNTVGITVLICGIVLGTTQKFFSTLAATEQAKASAEYTGREYKTVDGLKSLRFEKDNVCYYWHEGKLLHAKYFAVGGSWLEAVRLLAGCQRVKDIWYQAKGDRIIDSDGSTMYLATAPENAIAKKMWWYSGFADWHMKEHKSYPTDEQKWKDVAPDFYYTNPFNGKPDLPTFIQAKGAAAPTTPMITASGAAWPRQPAARPGAITALCLDYVRFFIRGYDRDGVLLTASKPGKYFYIELRDGQNITQDELLKFKDRAELTQDPTPVRVYMTQDAGVSSLLSFMKIGIPGGLWVLWLLSLAQSFVVLRLCDTVAKRLLSFAGVIVPTILLFMWYVIALGWV